MNYFPRRVPPLQNEVFRGVRSCRFWRGLTQRVVAWSGISKPAEEWMLDG